MEVIDIPMIAAAPQLYQVENFVIDSSCYWAKRGEVV